MNEQFYKYRFLLICLCLTAAIVAVYWPVYKYSFVSYDDSAYILNNTNIKNGLNFQSIRWAFTTGYANNWHPLTWLSHILDYQLFKNWAGGYHIVNVLFHILNTLLLFYLLIQMTGAVWPGAFVAAAFALHPLHVESVAWIAERKDVLSTFFWLLTMLAYVSYVKNKKIKWYLAAIVLFFAGLMSKPMLVTVPFVLLLLDYWPLERKFSLRLLTEKIPFFICSIASCIVTFLVQQSGGAMASGESFGLNIRMGNAAMAYAIYIQRLIAPMQFAVLIPHPGNEINKLAACVSAIALIIISIWFIYLLRKHKFFTVGWLWFIGTLIPVIGLVQVGPQAYADRYTYIPFIGLFIIIAFSGKEFLSKQNHICLSIILLLLWSFMTSGWLSCWENDETLYANTLRNTENNYIILGNYINCLIDNKRIDEAIEKSYELLKIKPDSAQAHCNLGGILLETGRMDQAAEEFKLALKYKPDLEQAYFNLALIERKKDNLDQAVYCYNEALKIKPDYVDAWICLAITLDEQNKIDEAIKAYRTALKIEPDNKIAKRNMNLLLKKYESR